MKYTDATLNVTYKGWYNDNKHFYVFKLYERGRGRYLFFKKDGTNLGWGENGSFSFLDDIGLASEEEAIQLEESIKARMAVPRRKLERIDYQIF